MINQMMLPPESQTMYNTPGSKVQFGVDVDGGAAA
jgi:hypothetical protein